MSQKRDYYEVLGVERSASDKQLADAFRKAARKYHPDHHRDDPDAAAKFKEAAEAYEVLNNADKRAIYDRYGHAGLEGQGAAPHFHDISEIFENFGDLFGGGLFGDLFGGRRGGRRSARRGADIRCEVTLDLLEAAHGTAKVLQFERLRACDECEGSGAKPGSKPERCSYCGGRGRVMQSTGFLSVQTTCPGCRGAGQVIRDACKACRGEGYVPQRVTRKLDIPAGLDDQTQIRIPGEGHPSTNGGPPGDCYCFVHVKDHPLFVRRGQDLICQVPIAYAQAALGATIEVPTLDGRESVTLPAGTQSGDVVTLRGRGMPDPHYKNSRRGDLLVQVYVEVPKKLTPEHQDLLRKLAEIEELQVSPKRKGFFESIREYFKPSKGPEQQKGGVAR